MLKCSVGQAWKKSWNTTSQFFPHIVTVMESSERVKNKMAKKRDPSFGFQQNLCANASTEYKAPLQYPNKTTARV